MSDLGTIPTDVIIARNNVGIEEQELQIDHSELRVMELDDEVTRIKTEQASHERQAKEKEALAAKPDLSPLDARRATISAREHRLQNQRSNVRLLEIAAERRQVAIDIASSRAHIASLRAENQQQQARLNGQETAHG